MKERRAASNASNASNAPAAPATAVTPSAVQLGSIELFCKAAQTCHFGAAAQALGLSPAAVSRSIARLEARLGTRLFVRTTRQVRLTEEGSLYYEQCRQALAQIAAAEQAIGGRREQVAGTLRVSLPTTWGHHRALPRLPAFMARHPHVRLDVQLSNHNIDFVQEGFDVAVRLGEPPHARLVARKLEDASLGIFAAPAYLAAHGVPQHARDLAAHRCIGFVRPSTGRVMPWLLWQHGRVQAHEPAAALQCQGDVLGTITLARAGAGLVQTYHFLVQQELAHGALVEVLPALRGASRPFHLLYLPDRYQAPAVRAFIDFMLEDAAPAPGRGGTVQSSDGH